MPIILPINYIIGNYTILNWYVKYYLIFGNANDVIFMLSINSAVNYILLTYIILKIAKKNRNTYIKYRLYKEKKLSLFKYQLMH